MSGKQSRKVRFDDKIKELSGKDDSCFNYKIDGRPRLFPVYFSNDEFELFCEEMENKYPFAYKAYSKGKGGELKSKKSRWGDVPPKMASVASSSRFIYLTLRDESKRTERIKAFGSNIQGNGAFEFEKELDIDKLNSKPCLDAYYKEDDIVVYFEAKCHELFDSHHLKWKKGYFEDGVLFGDGNCGMSINRNHRIRCDGQKYDEVKRAVFGLDEKGPLRFDTKQFVCHLLGIANDDSKKRELVYLYFKPKGLGSEFDDVYEYLEKQFKQIAESAVISDYCKKHSISLRLVYLVNDSMWDAPIPELKYSKHYE